MGIQLSARKNNEPQGVLKVIGFDFEEILMTKEDGQAVRVTKEGVEFGYKDDDEINKWTCTKKFPFSG